MPDEAMLQSFNEQVLDKPEVFLTRNEASAEQAKSVTKYFYDLGKATATIWQDKAILFNKSRAL